MKITNILIAFLFVLSSCVHRPLAPEKELQSSEVNAPYYQTEFLGGWDNKSRNVAGGGHISGYKIGSEMCGQGDLQFPRVSISTRPGYCVGIVAGQESGLIAPRTIVQIPGSANFLVVDFGGWIRNNGRVILLERKGKTFVLRPLLAKLDYPHGLAFGPDGKAYVGVQNAIFRFNPIAPRPAQTVELVIKDLPGMAFTMPNGAQITKNTHPLKQFVFDRMGAIYVNIGAPTDACLAHLGKEGDCYVGETNRPLAAIWKFTPQKGKIFKTLSAKDPNPAMEVVATGLRNSIAMVTHRGYPDPGYAFLQGENARDFPDPAQPNEELNAIQRGKHYGWPYCYNNDSVSPEYQNFISTNAKYKNLCAGQAPTAYQPPLTLFPPHSSPLDLKYYNGNRFSELKGKLLVTWHGYQPSGSRIAFSAVDERGFPQRNTAAVSYGQNCSSRKLIQTDKTSSVQGVQFEELITGWYGVGGVRPQGAPVGMTVADDGSLWVVEDKNASILRIDRDDSPKVRAAEPCDSRSEEEIAELIDLIKGNSKSEILLTNIRRNLVEKNCMGCHSNFNLNPEMTDPEKDLAVARYLLKQDSWFLPGNLKESRIHQRTRALGVDRPMPGNAAELLAKDPTYQQVVADLDMLINTIVPGDVYRVKLATAPSLKIRDANKNVCGAVPNQDEVLVVDKNPPERPGFVRIYKPAKKYLNGDCPPNSKYYLGADYLELVGDRSPSSAENPQAGLYYSVPHSQPGQFSFGIEGPAVAANGHLYAVNFQNKGTIGVVYPNGQAEKFLDLPKGSVGNSLAISSSGLMYVADYVGHKIYIVDPVTKELKVYVQNVGMTQPNDMALGKDDVLYLTDPNWKKKSSRIWRVSEGKAKILYQGPAIFNGIDLSPNGEYLYLADSRTNKIWRYTIGTELFDPQMIIQFKGFEVDGLKVDAKENIYVARITKGTVAKISPQGELLQEIALNGKEPTNLVFGGDDGKTVFVTQRDGGFIEKFRVEEPGRSWAQ